MSTAGLWEEPEDPAPRNPLVRTFTQKPRSVSMICWDGSDEALQLIARYGGQFTGHVPLRRDGNKLEIWVHLHSKYRVLELGDWAVIDPDDNGVYPVPAWHHEFLFDAVPEAGARDGAEAGTAALWGDGGWEVSS